MCDLKRAGASARECQIHRHILNDQFDCGYSMLRMQLDSLADLGEIDASLARVMPKVPPQGAADKRPTLKKLESFVLGESS